MYIIHAYHTIWYNVYIYIHISYPNNDCCDMSIPISLITGHLLICSFIIPSFRFVPLPWRLRSRGKLGRGSVKVHDRNMAFDISILELKLVKWTILNLWFQHVSTRFNMFQHVSTIKHSVTSNFYPSKMGICCMCQAIGLLGRSAKSRLEPIHVNGWEIPSDDFNKMYTLW